MLDRLRDPQTGTAADSDRPPHSAFLVGRNRPECVEWLRGLPDGEELVAFYSAEVAPHEDALMPPGGRFETWEAWRTYFQAILKCDARCELANRTLPALSTRS
jgi:hypothetical protein